MNELRRLLCILLSLVLLATGVFSTAVMAEENTVTAMGTGFTDVAFSNGYNGFCLDNILEGAYVGDLYFSAEDTSAAINNKNGKSISQELKILFTQGFEQIFVSDGNGGYSCYCGGAGWKTLFYSG